MKLYAIQYIPKLDIFQAAEDGKARHQKIKYTAMGIYYNGDWVIKWSLEDANLIFLASKAMLLSANLVGSIIFEDKSGSPKR